VLAPDGHLAFVLGFQLQLWHMQKQEGDETFHGEEEAMREWLAFRVAVALLLIVMCEVAN
jgi:hypothetical protein